MATRIPTESPSPLSSLPEHGPSKGSLLRDRRGAAFAQLCLATLAMLGGLVLPGATQMAQAQSSSAAASNAKPARVRWTPKPERGNARGTLSGGRRGGDTVACGPDADDTSLNLLVTDSRESLVTTQAQPTLAWQVKTQQPVEMELIVSDVSQAAPLFTQRLRVDETEVVQVELPPAAALSPGAQYRWTVVAQCPTGQKAEIYARSFIRQVSGESLGQQSSATSSLGQLSLEQAVAYADSGVWYDAVAQLLALPEQVLQGQPADLLAELLEQANPTTP